MKTIASILIFIVLAVVSAGSSVAAPGCGTTSVLTGCVGDTAINPTCVDRYEATYTVTAADIATARGKVARFCLSTTSTSLCGNTSAIATVTKNGRMSQTADLNDGGFIRVSAKEGDEIRVVVEQVDRNNGIQCFRQGELEFELAR